MKPLFDIKTINTIKKEDIKFECFFCGKIFSPDKRNVKRALGLIKGDGKDVIKYCNNNCQRKYEGIQTKIDFKCDNCGLISSKYKKQINKHNFCTRSCSATYNNKHKKHGTRRSKMEVWIETQLLKKYDIEMIFNGKEAIDSELDIYIPILNIAFELNGLFHYEPIFGKEKMAKIKNNDERKSQACLENGIEFCTIDTSGSKNFKPERDKKYLKIIENIIDGKLKQLIK